MAALPLNLRKVALYVPRPLLKCPSTPQTLRRTNMKAQSLFLSKRTSNISATNEKLQWDAPFKTRSSSKTFWILLRSRARNLFSNNQTTWAKGASSMTNLNLNRARTTRVSTKVIWVRWNSSWLTSPNQYMTTPTGSWFMPMRRKEICKWKSMRPKSERQTRSSMLTINLPRAPTGDYQFYKRASKTTLAFLCPTYRSSRMLTSSVTTSKITDASSQLQSPESSEKVADTSSSLVLSTSWNSSLWTFS